MNKMSPVVPLIGFVFLSGCASVKEGIAAEEYDNIAPFAEVTVEFLGADTIDLRDNELTYLRRYVAPDAAEIQRLRSLLLQIDSFRDEIVYYSVELVRISETHQNDAAKVVDLADTVSSQFRDNFLSRRDVQPAEFDAVTDKVRASQSFLAALREVQPLIVASGEYFESLVREAEEIVVPAVRDVIDQNVESEYATVIRQLEIIHARRDELMTGLQRIRAYRLGDKNALRGINDTTIISNNAYNLPTLPNDSQLSATKKHIVEQLQEENLILDLLQQDVDDYLATRAELDTELAEVLNGLGVAKRQVVAWIRGHQALANGARDPGKWLKAIFQISRGATRTSGILWNETKIALAD